MAIKKTKTSDKKEGVERLDESIFCCWGNGGCCFYELNQFQYKIYQTQEMKCLYHLAKSKQKDNLPP